MCFRDILTIPHAINMAMNQVTRVFTRVRLMSLLVFFSLLLSLSFSNSLFAQTIIWSEDFPESDGTTSDPEGKWSVSSQGSADAWGIFSNAFYADDLDGEHVWTSEVINISGFDNVSLAVDLISDNHETGDYIRVLYKLDGGSETYFSTNGNNEGGGDWSATASQTGLNGSTIQIIIRLNNDRNNEDYTFDNISVQGTLTDPPVCTTPVSPSNGESDIAVDATLDWEPASGATGYYLYFGTDGAASNIENGTDVGNVTSYTPSVNLNFLTDYYWRIVPYNSYGSASGCSVWTFSTANISYCAANSTSYDLYESITNVDFAGISNSSPVSKTVGYTDYSGSVSPGQVMQGQGYTIAITDEFLADEYGGYCKVYIDLDQNGDFDETNELMFESSYTGNQIMSGTVSIPLDASVGITRMRVVIEGDADNTGALPCGAFTWGEVEDYSVNINPFCSIATYNVTGGGSYCEGSTGVEIGLDGSEIGVDYQLYHDGATPVGSAISGNGNVLNFGFQSVAGTYTIVGHNVSEDCDLQMTGNAVIVMNPEPTLSGAAQNATICSGTAATINLSGLVPNTTFSLNYSIDGVSQSELAGLTADGSGNSSFATPVLDENADGKTLQITGITITGSTPNCTKSFSQNVILSVQPTSIDVNIMASPSGAVCSGTSVTYTAIPVNGGANPIYQWKVNGTNVGTNSASYSYTPADGDVVSCVMVSDALCATGSSSVPVTYFSWDDNSKTILEADYGLNANSGSGLIIAGGVAGSTALAPTPDPTRADINLTFTNSAELNLEGIDFSVYYQSDENTADIVNRGSSLTILGGGSFGVTYTVVDEFGVSTTQSSGSIANPRNDYPGLHQYRFTYNPLDGLGRLFIDGGQVWISSSATPGQILDWSGAGDLVIGNLMDASGSGIPTFDNLSISEILPSAATDSVTVSLADSPSVASISSLAALCAGEIINPAVPAVNNNGTSVTNEGWQLGGDFITVPYTVSDADDGKILQYYATNSCGTGYSNSVSLTVNPRPSTPVASSNSPVCAGSALLLTTSSVPGATYAWTGPNGFNSSDQNPTISSTWTGNSGTYTLAVTVGGCTSLADSIDVVVDAPTQGGWVQPANYDPVCAGSEIPLLTLQNYVGTVLRWERRVNTGSWEDIGNAGNVTYSETPLSAGVWEYRAVVQSGSCETANSTPISVTVNATPSITLGANPEVCQNITTASITYSATDGSPDDWSLVFDAGALSAGFSNQNGSLNPAPGAISINVPYSIAAGTYNGTLTVFTYYPACTSTNYPVSITVAESTPPSLIITGNNEVCAGTEVNYSATPTNGGSAPTYQWKVNGINNGTNSSSFAYTPADGDVVTCEMTSSATCTGSGTATSNEIIMIVNPLPDTGEIIPD